jgi:shikimate kinase
VKRHIVLIGLPGAGKTTVGRALAEQLGAAFIDIDAGIVRRMQMPVARIFAEHGESHFRKLELEGMQRALEGPPAVLAPGGGWAAQPGALDGITGKAMLVYLKTMVGTAARRAGGEGTRPLLIGEDPVEKMRLLLQERERFYLMAECEVKTDLKGARAIAEEIAQMARERAGW